MFDTNYGNYKDFSDCYHWSDDYVPTTSEVNKWQDLYREFIQECLDLSSVNDVVTSDDLDVFEGIVRDYL